MNIITGVAHVCLAARDLDETERFYCEGIGLRRAFRFLRDGRRVGFYLEVSPGTYVEVFQQSELKEIGASPIRHVCFATADIEAVRARLAALGCKVSEKTMGADRSWQAWTADPSGVPIEFHQYTPESCQATGQDCTLT